MGMTGKEIQIRHDVRNRTVESASLFIITAWITLFVFFSIGGLISFCVFFTGIALFVIHLLYNVWRIGIAPSPSEESRRNARNFLTGFALITIATVWITAVTYLSLGTLISYGTVFTGSIIFVANLLYNAWRLGEDPTKEECQRVRNRGIVLTSLMIITTWTIVVAIFYIGELVAIGVGITGIMAGIAYAIYHLSGHDC